jgi:spermidine synthase
MRRGDEYVIRIDGRELMGNRAHGSEDALSFLACDELDRQTPPCTAPRILIGGLGIGYTLAAALTRLGPAGEVVVAELVPAVAKWNRGPLGALSGHPLHDPRTQVVEDDVGEVIARSRGVFDAILLDVDNGPASLTRASNDRLYSPKGLSACYAALRPNGVLGVWSAAPDNAFTRRFERAGFAVTPHTVRARGDKGGRRHTIWIGIRNSTPPRWIEKDA